MQLSLGVLCGNRLNPFDISVLAHEVYRGDDTSLILEMSQIEYFTFKGSLQIQSTVGGDTLLSDRYQFNVLLDINYESVDTIHSGDDTLISDREQFNRLLDINY